MEKYKSVFTISEAMKYLNIHDNKVIAFDIECAPKNEWLRLNDKKAALDPNKGHIVGISLSVKEGTGIYIPLRHRNGRNVQHVDRMIAWLKGFIFHNESLIKVAHNIAYESSFLYEYGIVIKEPVFDTMMASMLTLKNSFGEFRTLRDSGLKTLAREIFNEDLPCFLDVVNGTHFDNLNSEHKETIRYACADSDFTLRLYNWFNQWFLTYIPEHKLVCERVESPAAVYTGIMKKNGIALNKELLQEFNRRAEEEIEFCKREILNFANRDINLGSNLQTQDFKDFIFKDLSLPVLKVSEKGEPSLDDESLILLGNWCVKNFPKGDYLIDCIKRHKRVSKLKSTYIEALGKLLNSETDRIHTDFFSMGTETGRFSSKNPNLQNLPRKDNDHLGIRKLFIPSPNHVFLDFDFSQIELRVGAYYCKDRKMINAFMEDRDIHAITTSIIYNIPLEEAMDKNHEEFKKRRTIAKNCNFGVFFGLFPRGLQKTLMYKGGINISERDCEKIIRSIKDGYPRLSTWQNNTKQIVGYRRYASSRTGRRRYLMDIRSKDWNKRAVAERCALNTPIQGTAADIIKIAMGRILRELPERDYIKPLLQIHDELLFEVREDKVQDAIAFIKDCMERPPFKDFNIPLKVEYSVGYNFDEV
ncbi:DNA polymerase [Clostridium sp. B9]|uniref:DNA polymerase n=1 Tax=Clostridium sp. B9 TaxID=3423224 RepID=UPI003D2F2BBF